MFRKLKHWLRSWLPDTDASLKEEADLLRIRLAAAELENELLGELCENLRRWLLANTAAAVHVGKLFGVTDEAPQPPAPGAATRQHASRVNGQPFESRL